MTDERECQALAVRCAAKMRLGGRTGSAHELAGRSVCSVAAAMQQSGLHVKISIMSVMLGAKQIL